MVNDTPNKKEMKEKSSIYVSIDHLKKGAYQLHILCKEKIVKTIKFKK